MRGRQRRRGLEEKEGREKKEEGLKDLEECQLEPVEVYLGQSKCESRKEGRTGWGGEGGVQGSGGAWSVIGTIPHHVTLGD